MRIDKFFQCPDSMDGSAAALKFTVNQILLLQRLKQTGLDKGQILKGLEEIEKIEETGFGSGNVSISTAALSNSNTTSSSPDVPSQCEVNQPHTADEVPSVSNREMDRPRNNDSPSPRAKFGHGNVLHPLGQPNPLMFGAHLQNPNQLPLLPPVASWPSTSQAVAVATAASLLQNGFPHSGMPPSIYPSLINGRSLLRNGSSGGCTGGSTVVEVDDERVDITEELEELFRRDQAAVKEDIRKFISERHISQSAIAKATKNAISQSYISQWLAQPQDISGQKKKAMYTWYLTERRKSPHGLTSAQAIAYRGSEMDQDVNSSNLLRAKRGARFTWPKECLTILENYYNSNSYPDECMREKIAHSCNTIIQSQKPGLILSELDKVTTVKVYNWFANRRKDDKRRRHNEQIENLSAQQLILSPRRNSTVSPTPSCDSNESNHDREAPMIKSEKSEQHVRKDEPMSIVSIAHEMEAVNRSILSLVQPHHSPSIDEENEHDASYGGARVQGRMGHFQNLTECRSFAG